MIFFQKSRIAALAACFAAISAPALAAPPTRSYCEANLAAANRAADQAVQSFRDTRKAGITAGVGGGCFLLSMGFGGLDFGATTALCSALMAGTWVTITPRESADVATTAFLRVRDRRCP